MANRGKEENVVSCPFHDLPLGYHGLKWGLRRYVHCPVKDCPMLVKEDEAQEIVSAVQQQITPETKQRSWSCYCHKPCRLIVSKLPWHRGRCCLICGQDEICRFFQWLDGE